MINSSEKVVSSFYKYARIESPIKFQKKQLALCKSLNLKGRILIGEEGINGSIYGTRESVESYKQEIRSAPLFSDIEFKEQKAEKPAFRKLFVRIRKEIVNSSLKVDLKNTADFISPAELKRMLDEREDIVLLDVRNNYESRIGKFANARTLGISNFREFPKSIGEIEDLKCKNIVAYCTGGIRCEKASAFLKESGFKNVFQLKGGILSFGEEFPNTYWQGKCFVFDDRIAIGINNAGSEPLAECKWCSKKCDDYLNCHNIECDKLFICCSECRLLHNKSCSEGCSRALKRRKESFFREPTHLFAFFSKKRRWE